MLGTLFFVLKIIGIILLVLVGLVLLLLGVLLFAPLRYRVVAKGQGEFSTAKAEATVSFLFSLIRGRVTYEKEKLCWDLRLAWKRFGSEQEQAKKEGIPIQSGDSRQSKGKKESVENMDSQYVEESGQGEKSAFSENREHTQTPKGDGRRTSAEGQASSEKSAEETESAKKQSIFQKLECTYEKICGKIGTILEMKEKVLSFVEYSPHQMAFRKVAKEGGWLLHRLKPKKVQADILFGFDDPATTGKVLAGAGMLSSYMGSDISLAGNFQEKEFTGDGLIAGKFRAVIFVLCGARLLLDRNVRLTIRHGRKLVAS